MGGDELDLNARTVSFRLFLEPSTPGAPGPGVIFSEMNVFGYDGTNNVVFRTINSPNTGETWPTGQWLILSSPLAPTRGTASLTHLVLAFRTFQQPWVGKVYFDQIRIQ
jgi:hypothetical protein